MGATRELTEERFSVGDFVVLAKRGLVLRDDRQSHLEPKVMDVLCALAAQSLRTTILSGVAAASVAPAFAQDRDDEIIVTGSRLDQANLTAPSPVFQVDDAEIDIRGVTRIEDLLNILPQVFASHTSEGSNDATGTSSVNLRNLGEVRTLVLLDGKRLSSGAVEGAGSNLDIIPTQLVERIDVVTGGASAVYGSDALAGVVNFILRRDFEGVTFDGQVGFYQDGNNNEFAQAVLAAALQPIPDGVIDGREVFAAVTIGANTPDGRGNVTAFLSYQNQNEVRQDARDYSACVFGSADPGPESVGGIGCIGSASFRTFIHGGLLAPENLGAGPLGQPRRIFTPFNLIFQEADGTLVPFDFSPSQTFNFAPDNFIQRPIERFNFTALSRYDLTDDVEAYLDMTFVNNTTDAQIAFSASFFRPFQVNCDNPFLGSGPGSHFEFLGCGTQVEQQVFDVAGNPVLTPVLDAAGNPVLDADGAPVFQPVFEPLFDASGDPVFPTDVPLAFGYRNVDGDPRNNFIETNNWRLVGGFRGTIGDNWNWDTYGTFARTRLLRISTADLNFARTQEALLVVLDTNGNPVCRSSLSLECAPWNVFERNADGSSRVTRKAVDFIQGLSHINSEDEQVVVGGTLRGELGDYGVLFPWAQSGVQGLLGVEWRRDSVARRPDAIRQNLGGRGLTGITEAFPAIDGKIRVVEIFMETQIPLIEGRSFFEEFGVNGAYRYSDYTVTRDEVSNGFESHTFAAGLTWAPMREVRFRGQFQRAVRAPNVDELFAPLNTGGAFLPNLPNGSVDPCAGDFDPTTPDPPPAATFAQCALTGVTAAQYGSIPDPPGNFVSATSGGNPRLDPETSATFTVGAAWTPGGLLEGFSLVADYYDIEIKDTVDTITAQSIVDQCFSTGAPVFCNLIVRDRFGSLFLDNSNLEGIQVINTNIATLTTRGVDVNATYSMDIPFVSRLGSLNFDYAASIMLEHSFESFPGAGLVDCKGLYFGDCPTIPFSEYRHRMLTTWQTLWDIDFSATWRFSTGVNLAVPEPVLQMLPGIDQIDSANYLDLALQWYARDGLQMRLGVQNVFGRDPEIAAGATPFGAGNTLPGVYDPLGRFIFVGIALSV